MFRHERVIDNMLENIDHYFAKKQNSQVKNVMLGVSGGIDSAFVAAMFRIWGKLPLHCFSLPIESNQDEMTRAHRTGEAFGDYFKVIDLTNHFRPYKDRMSINGDRGFTIKELIRLGNIKARLRMIELYDRANESDGLVLSTDNLTEYLLGFWTLHGDVGDFGIIQNVYKSELYELAHYLLDAIEPNQENTYLDATQKNILHDCIISTPTDGNGVSKSDFEQIGCNSYQEIDTILWSYFRGCEFPLMTEEHSVVTRHKNSKFKRENPFNIPRADLGL